MEWFRVYNDILDDYKFRRLGASKSFRFLQLLAYVNKNFRDKSSVPVAELQHFCNISGTRMRQLLQIIDECADMNIVEQRGDSIFITNWNKRQYKTDVVADRVAKYRKKHQGCNVTETLHVTPPETEQNRADTEEVSTNVDTRQPASKKPPFDPSVVVTLFGDILPQLPQPKKIDGARRKALLARMREHPDPEWWRDYFTLASTNPWYSGGSDRNWFADFDFFLRPKQITKITEAGKRNYDIPGKPRPGETELQRIQRLTGLD